MIVTLPYSAGDESTSGDVYNGTNKKLNIRGSTVANP